MTDYYWYRVDTAHIIGELRRGLIEEYLSESGFGSAYRLIPFERVPLLADDWDERDPDSHGYEEGYVREACRRLKTERPEVLYASDAPLLLTHRGRWIGVAPVIP